MQSLNTGVNVIGPVLAGVLYATIAHSLPYWLGAAMIAGALILLARVPFASPSKRDAAAPAVVGVQA